MPNIDQTAKQLGHNKIYGSAFYCKFNIMYMQFCTVFILPNY